MTDAYMVAERSAEDGQTAVIEGWLEVLRGADPELDRQARDQLIEQSKRRMEILCRKMFFGSLSSGPIGVDDIYQESALRLWKALRSVRPTTAKGFFGLAATQIRRVLIDLARKYARTSLPVRIDGQETTSDPASLEIWTRFHEEVGTLPEKIRDVVELVWYHDLTQDEAAGILGVDKSTVKRRWREARRQLIERLRDCL